MHDEEVMGGDDCRHSETGILPNVARLNQDKVHELVAQASLLHDQGDYGGALATLKVVQFGAGHLLPADYLRVRQKVHAAIKGMSRV